MPVGKRKHIAHLIALSENRIGDSHVSAIANVAFLTRADAHVSTIGNVTFLTRADAHVSSIATVAFFSTEG